jgi:hypothetical protein
MTVARYEVCGEFPIEERDADGNHVRDVPPGGVVELDDTRTNVFALGQAGLIKPVETKAPAVKATKET